MYPYDIILGMDLYDIFLACGVIFALVIARIFADRDRISSKLFNFIIIIGIIAIVVGYLSAVFVQAIYNWLDGEQFAISNETGATFFGGLTGGVVLFLVLYFAVGHIVFGNKENIRYFHRLLDIGAVSIACAHGFGRLGCLMAGCCHGQVTDQWYGIMHVYLNAKIVPLQLFESVFLLSLSVVLAILAYKKIAGGMAIYMILYGVWRFIIEYFRADDRGSTIVSFLSPSQLVSALLMLGSVGVWIYSMKAKNKYSHLSEV